MKDKQNKEGALVATRNTALLGDRLTCEFVPWDDKVLVKLGAEKCYVTKNELYQFVFAIVDASQRDLLMPVRTTEVMHYDKQHRVRAKKDIKKGEEIVVNCHIDVPVTIVEGLKGSIQKKSPLTI